MAKYVYQIDVTQFLLMKAQRGGYEASDYIKGHRRAIKEERARAQRRPRYRAIGERVRARFGRQPTTVEYTC